MQETQVRMLHGNPQQMSLPRGMDGRDNKIHAEYKWNNTGHEKC